MCQRYELRLRQTQKLLAWTNGTQGALDEGAAAGILSSSESCSRKDKRTDRRVRTTDSMIRYICDLQINHQGGSSIICTIQWRTVLTVILFLISCTLLPRELL